MPGRGYTPASGYRYGFNGMEKDDEVVGNGNSYDFGDRIYNPRLGRWLSLDPLQAKYASLTPYNFCGNNPIAAIDPDGREIIVLAATVSRDGVAPTRLGELGTTTPKLSLSFNKATNAFDLILSNHIQYTRAFDNPGANGKTIEQENPGLGLSVSTHENAHVDANVAAVNSNYEFKDEFGKGEQTFSGTADVIATQVYKAVNDYAKSSFNEARNAIEKEYEPLLNDAKGEIRTKIEQEKNAKIESSRNDITAKSTEMLNSSLNKIMDKVSLKIDELNEHNGGTGINKQTADKLPEGNAKKYQTGDLPVKSQGKVLKN